MQEGADGVTASSVISRTRPPKDVDAKLFAPAEIHRMTHVLRDFTVVHRSGIQIGGQVADLMESRWSSANGPADQLFTYLTVGDRIVVLTGTSPMPILPRVRQQILHMMTSFISGTAPDAVGGALRGRHLAHGSNRRLPGRIGGRGGGSVWYRGAGDGAGAGSGNRPLDAEAAGGDDRRHLARWDRSEPQLPKPLTRAREWLFSGISTGRKRRTR